MQKLTRKQIHKQRLKECMQINVKTKIEKQINQCQKCHRYSDEAKKSENILLAYI